MVNRCFTGSTKIEVVTVLANCGTDVSRAKEALVAYIQRKQEKGRSTEHILKKLHDLEVDYVRDWSLHPAFRDARALTYLPKSTLLPLPAHLRQPGAPEMTAQPCNISSSSTDHPSSYTPRSDSSSSPVDYHISPISPPSSPGHRDRNHSPSSPVASSSHIRTSYASPTMQQPYERRGDPSDSRKEKNRPAPIIVGSPSSAERSKRASLRSQVPPRRSSPPTTPLPALPQEHQVSSMPYKRSTYPSLDTRPRGPPLCSPSDLPYTSRPPFDTHNESYTKSRDGYPTSPSYSCKRADKATSCRLSENRRPMGARSISISTGKGVANMAESEPPPPYRDESGQLDRALQNCGASRVVRREVRRCLQQERGYEREKWAAVLEEDCGLAADDIPSLLAEMAREAERWDRAASG
ncbi:hypothetical protein BV22DRAFT_879267 [Leucogyrophana mollusca]|uniref:Uncharacterized protein n=1 Tax=Leucogyrophana mollusca TaxID=85980 RepID=A0ACB8B1I6_9AGAM|nr:hypothetical protein BV22DRAFT_879267 [Leucogyrophana mollusca]